MLVGIKKKIGMVVLAVVMSCLCLAFTATAAEKDSSVAEHHYKLYQLTDFYNEDYCTEGFSGYSGGFIFLETDDDELRGKFLFDGVDIHSQISFWYGYQVVKDVDVLAVNGRVKNGFIKQIDSRFIKEGYHTIKYVCEGTELASIRIYVRDFRKEFDQWQYEIINAATTDNMNVHEKMIAICDYLEGRFTYHPILADKEHLGGTIAYWGPQFRSYKTTSMSTPAILYEIAQKIGYKDIINGYTDGESWSDHQYAIGTYNGKTYRYTVESGVSSSTALIAEQIPKFDLYGYKSDLKEEKETNPFGIDSTDSEEIVFQKLNKWVSIQLKPDMSDVEKLYVIQKNMIDYQTEDNKYPVNRKIMMKKMIHFAGYDCWDKEGEIVVYADGLYYSMDVTSNYKDMLIEESDGSPDCYGIMREYRNLWNKDFDNIIISFYGKMEDTDTEGLPEKNIAPKYDKVIIPEYLERNGKQLPIDFISINMKIYNEREQSVVIVPEGIPFGRDTNYYFKDGTFTQGGYMPVDDEEVLIKYPWNKRKFIRGEEKDLEDEEEDKHEHSFADDWSSDDLMHWKDSTCGHYDTVNKEEHISDNGTRVEPECEKKGSITYKCVVCNKVMKIEEIDALNHSFGDWYVVKIPTENENGRKERRCDCGYTEIEEIPATGEKELKDEEPEPSHNSHIKDAEEIKEPTCEQDGDTSNENDKLDKKNYKPGTSVLDDSGTANYVILDFNARTVAFKKIVNKKARTFTVPNMIRVDGIQYKVTAISDKAFYKNKVIRKIIIGKNVSNIGNKVFYGCKNLDSITIKSTKLSSSTVKKNAMKGISKNTTIKVPRKKWKAYTKLLRKRGLRVKNKIKKY